MSQIKCALMDLNGCLQGPTPVELHEALPTLWKFIKATKNGGFLMGACSGRELSYVRGVLHLLGSPSGWSVYESGLGIFDVMNEIWIENPRITNETRQIFKQELAIRIPRILARYPGMVHLYKGNELHIALELTSRATFPIEHFRSAVEEDLKDLLAQNLLVIHSSTDTLDFTVPGIDKGAGVLQIQDVTGIPKEQMLGIGDTDGDLPMLNLTGFVGCPYNASNSCKELVQTKGGHISPFPYALGVADILNHFI